MATCYLHIGTEKTGTSSIQEFCHQNRSALAEQGVWYGQSPGKTNHRKIAVYARASDLPDDGFRALNIRTEEEHHAFQKQFEGLLEQEVQEFYKQKGHTFILSSEHCHSRLITESMVKKLYDLLARHFDSIRVICYLRPQVDVAISLASTAARVKKKVNQKFFDIQPDHYYDYYAVLRKWSHVFGKENVLAIPFNKIRNVVEHFVSIAGINPGRFVTIPPSNEALDVSTIALFNLTTSFQNQSIHDALRRIADRLPVRQKLKIPKRFAQEIHARFVESNRKVCAEFSNIQETDLTPDWNRYSEDGNLERTELPVHLTETVYGVLAALSRSENEISSLKAALNHQTKQNTKHESKISALTTEIQSLKSELAALSRLDNEISSLKAALNHQTKQNTKHESKISALTTEIQSLKSELVDERTKNRKARVHLFETKTIANLESAGLNQMIRSLELKVLRTMPDPHQLRDQ